MSVFFMELKKIWRLPVVFVILCHMVFSYVQWKEGWEFIAHPGERDAMMLLTERFGTTLEEEEYPLALGVLEELHEELDSIIENHVDFATNQVKDFATFKKIEGLSWERPSPDNDQALGEYMYANHQDLILMEQAFCGILEMYEQKVADPSYDSYSSSTTALVLEQWENGQGRSLIPYYPEYRTQGLIHYYFYMGTLYTMLLLLPTVVRDRKYGVVDLQWSSLTGRSILWKQYLAHWLTALVLWLPLPFMVADIMNVPDLKYFWDHSMLSFFYSSHYLLDFTLGELVGCYFIFSLFLSLFVSGLIFLLSQYSKNYPSLLLKAVGLYLVVYHTGDAWSRLFSLDHRVIWRIILPWSAWLEVYLLVLGLVLLGIYTFVTFRKEETRDLLD